eukprot:TRINITY_DN10704_c0_g2_i1.p1 TRINITY_DN10704_c0_g2~~TRINITY_DN10704_c0_g2_i1.p1  ORF type:complete len:221 (+),score=47.93 TRINITY_DN10704_c0_g2_i1:54-716(+)
MIRHWSVLLLSLASLGACTEASSDVNIELKTSELARLLEQYERRLHSQEDRIRDLETRLVAKETEPSPRALQAATTTAATTATTTALTLTALDAKVVAGFKKIEEDAKKATADIQGAANHIWLILCGALVMFMQSGFAMLEAGSVRAKNVQNVLLKNLTDVAVGTMGWWLCGWAFAYSGPTRVVDKTTYKDNKFMGYEQWLGHHFLTQVGGLTLKPIKGI